jgi:hypothetical protein
MFPPASSFRLCGRNSASALRLQSLSAGMELRSMRLVRLTDSGAGRSSTTACLCFAGTRSVGLPFALKRGTPFALSPSPSSSYARLATDLLIDWKDPSEFQLSGGETLRRPRHTEIRRINAAVGQCQRRRKHGLIAGSASGSSASK